MIILINISWFQISELISANGFCLLLLSLLPSFSSILLSSFVGFSLVWRRFSVLPSGVMSQANLVSIYIFFLYSFFIYFFRIFLYFYIFLFFYFLFSFFFISAIFRETLSLFKNLDSSRPELTPHLKPSLARWRK